MPCRISGLHPSSNTKKKYTEQSDWTNKPYLDSRVQWQTVYDDSRPRQTPIARYEGQNWKTFDLRQWKIRIEDLYSPMHPVLRSYQYNQRSIKDHVHPIVTTKSSLKMDYTICGRKTNSDMDNPVRIRRGPQNTIWRYRYRKQASEQTWNYDTRQPTSDWSLESIPLLATETNCDDQTLQKVLLQSFNKKSTGRMGTSRSGHWVHGRTGELGCEEENKLGYVQTMQSTHDSRNHN